MRGLSARLPLRVPVMIGSGEQRSGAELISTDPGERGRVVAVATRAGEADVGAALEEAGRGLRAWPSVGAGDRAAALLRAAAWLREPRLEIAALQVRECA